MISHTKKFVLITPPKTASTSITDTLKPILDIKRIIPQIDNCYDYIESLNNAPAKHKTANDYKQYTDQYHVAGCIRNPFDRLCSWWKWMPVFDKQYVDVTFNQFVKTNRKHPVFAPQYNFFTIDGQYKLDTLIRFENLQQDFDMFCGIVNLPRIKLAHVNNSNRGHYSEYYDDETREIVAKKYAKDIEMFGYEFEA